MDCMKPSSAITSPPVEDAPEPIPKSFFSRPALEVARDLIGAGLFVDGVGGRIVEAEAYEPEDPASHSFCGERTSNASMFKGPGLAYVYRSYGIHWCFNVVCNTGSAVLIRALEPTEGIVVMQQRRGDVPARSLCAGPGNLTKALALTREHDGLPLSGRPFQWQWPAAHVDVVVGRRIGITKAIDAPWRFGLAGSKFVSRRF
jgi:DNA-3-methyladenine glycosylase